MTWARLDDTFHHHPKPLNVTLSALGLFALGLSYAADNNTGGRLPEKWVLGRIIGDDQTAPQQLVDVGLWEKSGEMDGVFVIHDYHDYNLTPEELEEKREKDRSRKRKQRENESQRDSRGTPGTGKGTGKEFEEWLEHYRQTTGRRTVRGSQPARDSFVARRKEGRSLDDLKLATIGCHADDYCRENGFDVPDTILRASKVERYIQLGRKAKMGAVPAINPLDRLADRQAA